MSKRYKKRKKKGGNNMYWTTGASNLTSGYKFGNYGFSKMCHDVTEIHSGLFVGGKFDIEDAIASGKHFDYLYPLDSLDGKIWRYCDPETTEIRYYPVEDYGVVKTSVLDRIVNEIIQHISEQKTVALFCMGGHGRTGYVACCILGKLGYQDPIAYIREVYCKHILETASQVDHLVDYTGLENLKKYSESYKTEEKRQKLISRIFFHKAGNSFTDSQKKVIRGMDLDQLTKLLIVMDETIGLYVKEGTGHIPCKMDRTTNTMYIPYPPDGVDLDALSDQEFADAFGVTVKELYDYHFEFDPTLKFPDDFVINNEETVSITDDFTDDPMAVNKYLLEQDVQMIK